MEKGGKYFKDIIRVFFDLCFYVQIELDPYLILFLYNYFSNLKINLKEKQKKDNNSAKNQNKATYKIITLEMLVLNFKSLVDEMGGQSDRQPGTV